MKLYLLGATGNIGMQVLDIVDLNPHDFEVETIAAGRNIQLVEKIIDKYQPKYVSVLLKEAAKTLEAKYPNVLFGYGDEGLVTAATFGEGSSGLVVNSIVGSAGLLPTYEAIKKKRNIALANKETLVIGGDIIMPLARKNGVSIIPIDSEHSALMHCLKGENIKDVNKLVITASGGSFRDKTRKELKSVTVKDALNHPNWTMGAKITIDSATMMNKGFEIIEAHHLFDISYDKIEAVLHKESIVHAMVEFNDHSYVVHLGMPDMRVPINAALYHPKRNQYQSPKLSLTDIGALHFTVLDETRYPMITHAIKAGEKGGYAPTVLNAANEAAVALFLSGKITFLQIEEIVLECLNMFDDKASLTIDKIIAMDEKVKDYVNKAHS
jgi:1-deoxy-D-xylulose-5-phosphate reductoisomerase